MRQKFNYRNEAAFSKAVVTYLRKQGYFVQRIESGLTGRGIPDIYCITPTGVPIWLELKREHCSALYGMDVYISWRPGQQSWLTDVTHRKQIAYTLACFDDVILQISHYAPYKDNRVPLSRCVKLFSLREL